MAKQVFRGLLVGILGLVVPLECTGATVSSTVVLVPITVTGGTPTSPFPLTVSSGVLQTASGAPYLILGDAPQGANVIPLCAAGNTYALCAPGGVLNADTLPGNATFLAYAKDRQAQGFNSLWINILCENYTSCDNTGATQEGTRPFTTQLSGTGFPGGTHYTTSRCPENGSTSATPNDMNCWDMMSGLSTNGTASGANAAYWTHIDGYFKIASALGMQVLANPMPVDGCGSQSIGFMYLNNYQLKSANINGFADFLYNRYGNPTSPNYAANLIWWFGNDWGYWDAAGQPSCPLTGADAVLFAFASRLQTDEAAAGNHLMITELDGITTSLTNTPAFCPSASTCPSAWNNIVSLNGSYFNNGPMYDIALTARGQSSTLPPVVVEGSYQGENIAAESDGTDGGTIISGCGNTAVGGTDSLTGDPNACPFRERAQFWPFIIAGGSGGFIDGNHYSWTFGGIQGGTGWNNGSVAGGSQACTGTSGSGHSPCLDTRGNANLVNGAAFLQNKIAWYKLLPDMTRGVNGSGYGTGVAIASPLVTGCFGSPGTACTNYYIGRNHTSGTNTGGVILNTMPTSGVTSDGAAGIVYVPGINSSCAYYQFNGGGSNAGCSPQVSQQFTVNNAKVNGGSNVIAAWYDPTGTMASPTTTICSPSTTPCNSGSQTYTTPGLLHSDSAADWVLLLTHQ